MYIQNKYPQNTLLLKNEVGKSKPTIYNFPENFVFGRWNKIDSENAKEGLIIKNNYL